jgi:hypothetical protein
MANFQALLIGTQLPLDGVAGRLRPHLVIAKGERGRFFEFSATKCQLVPRLAGVKKVRKLNSLLHLRMLFPRPKRRGTEIHTAVGQMKRFMRLKSGDVRTPAERAIRDNAPFKAAARGQFCASWFAAAASGCTASRGGRDGAKRTNEANRRQVAGFAYLARESGVGSRNQNRLAFDNVDGFYERTQFRAGAERGQSLG